MILKDDKSSLMWRFLFFFLSYVHLIVLFILLFLGLDGSVISIGYMIFFIVYTLFPDFYRKTSVLLIIFTSIFIWGKYLYTVLNDNGTQKTDTTTFDVVADYLDMIPAY